MIDGHIHLERGDYTIAWLNEFIKTAQARNISEIRLLEHSHRFTEFQKIYKSIVSYNDYQKNWLSRHMNLSIKSYQRFVEEMRKRHFPIKIQFGLEVCYIEDTEEIVRNMVENFNWDFVTGSVHWIDGFGFDHKPEFWYGKDVNSIYTRYYEIMKNLIRSGLFTTVAHPDSIKCFGHKPTSDLSQTYDELADLLNAQGMSAEMSAGLHINYGCTELGLNPAMLKIFKKKNVRLITVSDAHDPQSVGKYIKEMDAIIKH